MPDPTTPDVATKPPAKGPENALRELADFLDRVTGPRLVQIEDLLGNVYQIPSALPARVEARFFRVIREMEGGPVDAMFKADGAQEWGEALLGLLSDDRLIDAADEAFVSAFPKVIAEARAASDRSGEPAFGNRPSDLFALSEVALALTPFVAGALRAASKMINRFVPTTPKP